MTERLLLQSVSGQLLEVADPNDGTTEQVRLDERLDFDPQPHVGQYLDLDLVETRGGWRIYKVRLTSDESQVWSVDEPPLLGDEGREGLSTLLAAIFGHSSRVPTSAVERLANAPYFSSDEAVFAIGLVANAARDDRLEDPTGSLTRVLGGEGFRWSIGRARAVLEAALGFDDEAVRANGRELMAYAMQHAEYWEDDEDIEPIAAVFRQLEATLKDVEFSGVIEESLDPGFGATYQIRVLRGVALRIAPDEAIEAIGRLLETLLAPEVSERDIEIAAEALDALEDAAHVHPAQVAQVLGPVAVTEDTPNLCARLLSVVAAGGLTTPLNPEVIRAGARVSDRGAIAAIRCLATWDGATEDHLQAVFEGVGAHPDGIDPEALATAIELQRDVMTPIDQLGAVAHHGAIGLAEKAAPSAGVKRGLLRELFAAAKRVADLRLVNRRLTYAEAWKEQAKANDREAIDAYIAEIKKVKKEERFAVVMASLLRFFPAHRDVPSRGKLRDAVFGAMKRVEPIKSDDLQALLEQARVQLPLETPSTSGHVSRLFSRTMRRQ